MCVVYKSVCVYLYGVMWCVCVCVVDICVYMYCIVWCVCVCVCTLMYSSKSVPIEAFNPLSPATIAGMFMSKGLNNESSETNQGPCL